jgi:Tfp pilus assembly protein PilO
MLDNLDKKQLLSKLFTEKNKDYSYTIIFFLIFSFFVFFIIRPNVLSIFQANLQIENLKKTNAIYEYQIQNVIDVQSILVNVRDDLPLLDEAVTSKPQINQLINDITKAIEKNHLEISKLSLANVNLKDISKTEQFKPLVFDLGLTGSFDNYLNLMKDIYNDRRIKLMKDIVISKEDKSGTNSGTLQIELQLEGYYL